MKQCKNIEKSFARKGYMEDKNYRISNEIQNLWKRGQGQPRKGWKDQLEM